MKKQVLILLLSLFIQPLFAVEGMWIPTLLKKYNIDEMTRMGFKLTAEDIYDVNNASMKDAVVLFGNGCTGEMISPDGLLLTNHHCGFGQIQSHSTTDHDYLRDGFWAQNRSQELVNKNLTVSFLVRMEEVTKEVNKGISGEMTENDQKAIRTKNIKLIQQQLSSNSEYQVDVKPLFYGNQYFAYVYEVFKDVRLVGAPPSSIGKFGGDTDNWVWPRHTGDFSLFRVYASKNNKPATYSPDNVPYKPKKYFHINLKGIKENDFTMVFGFPGSTQEYLPSNAIKLIMELSDPTKIDIRTAKLSILEKRMASDQKIGIQYASKYASVANSWKKWQGEVLGLKRLNAVQVKKDQEKAFQDWVMSDPSRKARYGSILSDFKVLYDSLTTYQTVSDYYSEVLQRGTDIFTLAGRFDDLIQSMNDSAKYATLKKSMVNYLPGYLKDWDQSTDAEVFGELMKMYARNVPSLYLTSTLTSKKSGAETSGFTTAYYKKSILADSVALNRLVRDFGPREAKLLMKDPLFSLYKDLKFEYQTKADPIVQRLNSTINSLQKRYMAAIMEFNEGKKLMADANLTLRVSYGKVEGFEPRDGVTYNYFTTLDGVFQKESPEIADYQVPERLRTLYNTKDFGSYTDANGKVPVAFCASNHTTGGNSGSPVINASGELIGINFDRCWEGTMSDLMFDPDRCRNIAMDVRYILFIIDKYANAGWLLNEMTLIR